MLGTIETIGAVAEALDLVGEAPVVLDPVMVAESGAELLEPDARAALVSVLLPRATVVTPNVDEARALVDGDRVAHVESLARSIHLFGPPYVVVTGGHGERSEEAVDVYFDGSRTVEIAGERYPDGASHGSGCTHSSVLAAQLALGVEPLEAAREAKRIASEAVRDGLPEIGAGTGPVNVLGIPVTDPAAWHNPRQ
jgi:hydroxymethylpyrimidine/phosphomethylpyrimidine kinase